MLQEIKGTAVGINLTRLVEASKGAGGAGWFGIEICEALVRHADVTVVAGSHNADYVSAMVKARAGDRVRIEIAPDTPEEWLNGRDGAGIDCWIDPLNGLEPYRAPAHVAMIAVIHDLMFRRDPYVFTQAEINERCHHYGDAIRRADLVITVAEREARDMAALFPGKPVHVVDQPAYFPARAGQARQPGEPVWLFSPGVQWNHKNHFRLVSAFLQLLRDERIPADTRLCLSAILPVEANHQLLRPLIEASPHGEAVIQMPYLERARFRQFMERCDGLVLPSVHEGYGIPVTEAVAGGKPILTARVPSLDSLSAIPDFVRFIENPKDVGVIADALEDFIRNLPQAQPSPQLCPSPDRFAGQMIEAVNAAMAARRQRSRHDLAPPLRVKQKAQGCAVLLCGTPSQDAARRAADHGLSLRIYGAAHGGGQQGEIACASDQPDLLALHLAHDLVLAETDCVLICNSSQFDALDLNGVTRAAARLRAVNDKAKVRLIDLGVSAAALEESPLLPAPGLYCLERLALDFECMPGEIQARLDEASVLYEPLAARALILDPSLKNANGHHLAVATDLARSLTHNGYVVTVAGNFTLKLHGVNGARQTTRGLSDYLYEQNGNIGMAHAEFVNQFRGSGIVAGDLVYAFCATPTMLASLALVLAECKAAERPHVVIRFDRPEWRTPETTIGYAEAFALINQFGLRGNFSFSVESSGLQRCFEQSAKETFPIRFNFVDQHVDPLLGLLGAVPEKDDEIIVAFVGEAREEKGFQLLPDVVEAVQAQGANVRFRIQCGANVWNQTPPIQSAIARLEAMAKADTRIELLGGALPEDQYLDLIRSADIVFLPYNPPQYRIRGSGVATQAAAFGTQMVVSHGLDIVDTFQGFGATQSRSWSTGALADALIGRIRVVAAQTPSQRRSARMPVPTSENFALSFIQAPETVRVSENRIVLWISNDTRGEGSETVYRSQLAYLRDRGYFVIRLVAPYPARWRLTDLWQFDASAFVADGEIILNFRPGRDIEAIMDDLSGGGDVLANFSAAWERVQVPPMIKSMLTNQPPAFAVVNYAHHIPIVESLCEQDIPMVVETHDIQALQYAIQQNRAVDPVQLEREMQLVDRFDQIVSISHSEAAVFGKHCSPDKVNWCMPFVDAQPITLADDWDHDLLFVGSAHHANVASLKWFLKEVYEAYLFPMGLSLTIVGTSGDVVDVGRFGDKVKRTGRVQDIAPYYARAGLVALPIMSGAGVPIKVIDAMTRGVPFVMTDFPARAMDLAQAIPVADSAMAFAEQVLSCLWSPEERRRRVDLGRDFVNAWASREHFWKVWDEVVAKLPRREAQ